MSLRGVGALCAVALALSNLAACTARSPTESDVVGVWVETNETRPKGAGKPCAYLEFRPDGSFEAHNLAEEYFLHMGFPFTSRVDISGTWQLQAAPGDVTAPRAVSVTVKPDKHSLYPYGYDETLYLSTLGSAVLFAGTDAGQYRLTFTRGNRNDCDSKP